MSLSNTAAFAFERRALELRFRTVRLAAREWLAPDYVRIRLEGDELAGFDSPGHDDHIRIFFPDGEPEGVDELRAAPSREYTPLSFGDGWLELEFAVHGDEGVAAPWAAHAPLGSVAGVGGPRGSRVMTGSPDAWFLAGDETAIPAIRRFASAIEGGQAATILVEVPDADHEVPIDAPVAVEYLHRGTRPAASTLAARLSALGRDDRQDGEVFGFVAAEQSVVKPGRALLLERWGLDPDRVTVKGYWKRDDAGYHAPH